MTRWLGSIFLAAVTACSGGVSVDVGQEDLGEARLALSSVPPDVACIRLVATGPTRTVERRLDIVTGASSSFALSGLPTGNVVFSGDAYGTSCNQISNATPTWIADPASAFVGSSFVADVHLTFIPNGRATITADFDNGGDAGADSGGADGTTP